MAAAAHPKAHRIANDVHKNDRSLLHTAHPEGPAMNLSNVFSG